MAYNSCCKVMENKSNIIYSYNNTERIVTKTGVSNTTSIKIYEPYSYNTCLKNTINARRLCINRYSSCEVNVMCDIQIKDYYIECYNNNRNLIIDFELYIFVDNMKMCNKRVKYCQEYEYVIQIDNYDVYDVNVNIDDIDFEILRNENIKVYTFIEIKF